VVANVRTGLSLGPVMLANWRSTPQKSHSKPRWYGLGGDTNEISAVKALVFTRSIYIWC
jgi:hypothetical protein